jgi:uncharacterized protein YbjT (DUF2867 family)
MKVFVTGATGFVGQAVVKALRQRNHEVVGLVRNVHKGQALEQLGATLVVGDMLSPAIRITKEDLPRFIFSSRALMSPW